MCLSIRVNNCNDYLELPLVATSSGTWKLELWFNGYAREVEFTTVEGEKLIIPNIVNEDYTHEAKIYTETGALFNATCYKFKTYISMPYEPAGDSSPFPPYDNQRWYSQDFVVETTVLNAITIPFGSVFESELLQEAELDTVIYVNNQPYQIHNPEQLIGFDPSTGSLNLSNLGELPAGTLISVRYYK